MNPLMDAPDIFLHREKRDDAAIAAMLEGVFKEQCEIAQVEVANEVEDIEHVIAPCGCGGHNMEIFKGEENGVVHNYVRFETYMCLAGRKRREKVYAPKKVEPEPLKNELELSKHNITIHCQTVNFSK